MSASSTGLPHVVASVCASAASSSSSSWARSRRRRGSMIATSADGGQQIGQQVFVGGEPRQPRLHAVEGVALREPFPLLAAPRLGLDQLAGARLDLVGRQQLAHREDPRLVDLARRALIGDREVRQPVDLVAPQVDAHRVIGGGGIDVDDRAPHRDLAARLDLVLAPVADRDEPGDELVAVDLRALAHDDRLDVLDVRAEALHERAHRRDDRAGQVLAAGAQAPDDAQPAAHRLGRGRHPLERQRLPRREELDRVVAEELAQVGGDALGLDAGRHRDDDRPPRRRPRERRREQRARGLGHRDRAREAAGRGGDRRIVGEQGGQPGKGGRHGRAFYPGTRTRPGYRQRRPENPTNSSQRNRSRSRTQTLFRRTVGRDSGVRRGRGCGRCSGSSRPRRRR